MPRVLKASGALCALVLSLAAAAQVAVPPLGARVTDLTGTLDAGQRNALEQTLAALEARKGAQVAVLIVPTTQPETVEQYAVRVEESWKLGRKRVDDGVLLVVAKNDRRMRIEVGYGLEGALNDATSRRIIDEDIAPLFRKGDFAGGIRAGVERIVKVIDGEPLPARGRAPAAATGLLDHLDWLIPGFVALMLVQGVLRGVFGRLLGSGVSAGVAGVAIWMIFGSIAAALVLGAVAFFLGLFGNMSSGRGGGWYSGGSSGGWSSGGGGFSGGGGSSGGGGASGSW